MPTKVEKDTITGTDTTGHEWDGIKELNRPLPKWWLYVFYACILWSAGYYILYPSWPTLSTHLPGIAGYWSRGEVAQQLKALQDQRAPYVKKIEAAAIEDVRNDQALFNFAIAGGRAAYADNCAPCHGPGGGGTKGFPNLADDKWLWGGTLQEIQKTIAYGVRNPHKESRQSQMPRFGADGMLTPAQIDDVAEHVLSLRGNSKNPAAAARGAPLFAENCVACHGEKAEGNVELGAPSLKDGIWQYGGDKASIVQTIAFSRNGSMPAWSTRLDDATIKMLTLYVYSLGGGK